MAGNGQLVAANFIQSQKNKNILVDAKQYEYRQKTKSGCRSRRSGRMVELKLSLEHYDRNNIKEFMYGLRGDVI